MSQMMTNFMEHRFLYAEMMNKACQAHFRMPRGKPVTVDQMKEFYELGYVFILKEWSA